MKIDLSVLEVGDEVELRSGATKTVSRIAPYADIKSYFSIIHYSDKTIAGLTKEGIYWADRDENLSDIVAIHSAKKPAPTALDLARKKAKAGDKIAVELILDEGGAKSVRDADQNYPSVFTIQAGKIIALEPALEPEFDWKTVKPGMAFTGPRSSIYGVIRHFIGRQPKNPEVHSFEMEGSIYNTSVLNDLKRAPEHDIKLPEASAPVPPPPEPPMRKSA